MPKRKPPVVTATLNTHVPDYDISGLEEDVLRITKHIDILETEARLKRAELKGLKKLIIEEKTRDKNPPLSKDLKVKALPPKILSE